MRDGGMNQTLGLSQDIYNQNRDDSVSRIMAQSRGGTAGMRALGRETGRSDKEFALGVADRATRNQFAGAQGMQGMPGFLGSPSNLENRMLGLQSGYDLSNLQARSRWQGEQAAQQGRVYNANWDTVDTIVGPSWFNQNIAPILQGGLSLGAGYLAGS